MYRKIVWCYIFILTLLDITLNTKLSAQGKSHGVTVHDSLVEGITFQEWGKETTGEGNGRGGRAMSAGALSLSPPALDFGSAALATAHALTVTLTNTANTTMHLASVAGTTPDFHASFFEAKTLPPQANTTFSVVYLGRREGPVSAHLYIHTSLGVHKYPVSAVGVASEWGVWPLVGVRVPQNATVEPLLTLYNPTDQTIQVSEVYSSGSWVSLSLPDGGAAAPRAAWAVPPRRERALVRMRLAPPQHPLTAYIRIKANITGGGLVVCVEARSAPPGEYTAPLQLRLRTRGSQDPHDELDISAGNSATSSVNIDASVWGARCSATPPAVEAPPPHATPPLHNGENKGTANGNGAGHVSRGAHVASLRTRVAPRQEPLVVAKLTLDYARMWAGVAEGGQGAWCGGWVLLGRAALPYSVRLLPGTLRLLPHTLHFVTANKEEVSSVRELRVRNEFPVPVHIAQLEYGPDVHKYFEVEWSARTVVAGEHAAAARVRLRSTPPHALRTHVTLRTNVTDYTLALLVYSGLLDIEWEWPNSAGGALRLGAVGASSTRRIRGALRNRGVAALCVVQLRATLPGALLALDTDRDAPRCVAPGESLRVVLTVVAAARAGPMRGEVLVQAARDHDAHDHDTHDAHDNTWRATVELDVQHGRVRADALHIHDAAPYAWSSAPLVLDNTMALSMRMLDVTLPPDNPALLYQPLSEQAREVSTGRQTVGTIVYAPEKLCEPNCYTGLDIDTPEGARWLERGRVADVAALALDAQLRRARHDTFLQSAHAHNLTLHAHTSHVLQIPVEGRVSWVWPALAVQAGAGAGDAALSCVGGSVPLRVAVRNPSRSHALLLQPVIAAPLTASSSGGAEVAVSPSAFRLAQWRGGRAWGEAGEGDAAGEGEGEGRPAPLLLLEAGEELELQLSFTPHEPRALTANLYLRNNLTIMEEVKLSGRGAYPSFELGGKRPGTDSPLLFEVTSCEGSGGGVVRRRVVAHNTGGVALAVRGWRVAGVACAARGFRVSPCAPLHLAPNESRALTLSFSADWTLARVSATLTLKSELGSWSFPLSATAPARLVARCSRAAPRPAWDAWLRGAGTLLALAALALVLAAAALDAERALRKARHQRHHAQHQDTLDLRALHHLPQAPPPPLARRPPSRKRRAPRPPADPAAERRAFERWRHDVLRRQEEDERSSEDNESPAGTLAAMSAGDSEPLVDNEASEQVDEPPVAGDGYEADPETEDRPPGSGDEDAASTGSGSASASSSSPTADADEPDDELDRTPPPDSASPLRDSPPASPRGPPADVARPARPRRSPGATPRRHRAHEAQAPRPPGAKLHARKDKPGKRRERVPASPPRSPARSPPRAALRWGASWSSVVAAGAAGGAGAGGAAPPLAPIGSDVRRRPEPAPDHSLFYFNGDTTQRDGDFAWRPPPPPPPQLDRPTFSPARGDFLDEPAGVSNSTYRSVWGSPLEARWLWDGFGAVRPPPGFGAPPARPVRPYDPFRSLASIWAPGALDWRSDTPPAPDEPST